MKRPQVALGGPSASAKVLVAPPPRCPTGGGDDEEVEVVHIPSKPELIPFPRLRVPIAISRRSSMAIHAKAKRRGKALDINKGSERCFGFKKQILGQKNAKDDMLPLDRQERRNRPLEENIRSFFPGLITIRHLLLIQLSLILFLERVLKTFFFPCSLPMTLS